MRYSFHPRTLLSDAYLTEVYDTIPRNIKGIKAWFSPTIQNRIDRKAFEDALDTCWIVSLRIPYDGKALLDELRQVRAEPIHLRRAGNDHNVSLFDVDSWTCKPTEYYTRGIDTVIEVVEGIVDKYLKDIS